jgi:beta-lactamase superfamily II metal-dependent hydrolase
MTAKKATVRMYNVGFGDAFLILLPGKGRPHRILVDCGSIKSNGIPMQGVVDQIVADATDKDGTPRIDLVIATHRHRDHVFGFEQDGWEKVEVGEVWMPWTEDPDDPKARRIRETQSGLAAALVPRLQARLAAGSDPAGKAALDMALNALTNEAAMATLHHGFAGTPTRRYLSAQTKPLTTPHIPGATFHILGPSRDEAVIRDMDPPKNQSYLAHLSSLDPGTGGAPEPFGAEWHGHASPPTGATLTAADKERIDGFSEDVGSLAAVALDKAVNGTSLLIVLKVGKAHLLLPGDAQWGTWNAAMQVPEWQALLRKTTFYKVGHHGSHNATPVKLVEEHLPKDFWAMASTMAVDQWPSIPKKELLAALGKHSPRIARSDQAQAAPKPWFSTAPGYVEASIPM